MKCRDFEKYAGAYLAGTLSEDILRLMSEHMTECTACAESFRLQEIIGRSLSESVTINAPDGLADRILEAVALPDIEKEYAFPTTEFVVERNNIIDCKAFDEHAAAFVDGLFPDLKDRLSRAGYRVSDLGVRVDSRVRETMEERFREEICGDGAALSVFA